MKLVTIIEPVIVRGVPYQPSSEPVSFEDDVADGIVAEKLGLSPVDAVPAPKA